MEMVRLISYQHVPSSSSYLLYHSPMRKQPATLNIQIKLTSNLEQYSRFIRRELHSNQHLSLEFLTGAQGEAKLCDFGVSKTYEKVTDASLVVTMSTGHHSSMRWMAPEFLRGEVERPTFITDVYSFGMTVLECVTGQKPYAHLRRVRSPLLFLSYQTQRYLHAWASGCSCNACSAGSPSASTTTARDPRRLVGTSLTLLGS
jgi:serine/threonine protein kinase